MLVVNGFISVCASEGNGFDEKGNPIVESETLGEPIPCCYVRNSYQGKGTYEGGVFTSASYTILIAPQEFKPCRFHLYDLLNNDLGEYQVQQKGITILQAVGNLIQITV